MPEIEFKEFEQYTDSAKLVISFIDCDGDIGLTQSDTSGDYKYNLYLEYFELQNGVWTHLEPIEPFYYRIPMLKKDSKEEVLQGDIEVMITPYYYNRFSNFDTLRYEVKLVDRSLNESNVVMTRTIIAPWAADFRQ